MRLFLSISIVVVTVVVVVSVIVRRVVADAESSIEDETVRAASDVDDAWSRVALNVSARVIAVWVQVFALVDVVIVANVTG